MPYGLNNAPATFHDMTLCDVNDWIFVAKYIFTTACTAEIVIKSAVRHC